MVLGLQASKLANQTNRALIPMYGHAAKIRIEGKVSRQNVGWTLEEAIDRCVDRSLFAKKDEALRAWKEATVSGARVRFYRSDEGALVSNPINARYQASRSAYLRACVAIPNDLLAKLADEVLIAFGRKSPTGASDPVPGSAWHSLTKLDLKKSEASEPKSDQHMLYDVRIFPALEAPNASKFLEGRSLAEIYARFILGDPEFSNLRSIAIAGGHAAPEQLLTFGRYRMLMAVQDVETGDPDPIGILAEPKDQPAQSARRVLQDRSCALVSVLKEGLLEAQGLDVANKLTQIPVSIWQRRGILVNFETGDLHELRHSAVDIEDAVSEPIFKALMVAKPWPAAFEVAREPANIARQSRPRPRPSGKTTNRTAKATDDCRLWLATEMKRSPDAKPKPKAEYFNDAKSRFDSDLPWRRFDLAWRTAIAQTGAEAWSYPGAPRKSKRN